MLATNCRCFPLTTCTAWRRLRAWCRIAAVSAFQALQPCTLQRLLMSQLQPARWAGLAVSPCLQPLAYSAVTHTWCPEGVVSRCGLPSTDALVHLWQANGPNAAAAARVVHLQALAAAAENDRAMATQRMAAAKHPLPARASQQAAGMDGDLRVCQMCRRSKGAQAYEVDTAQPDGLAVRCRC